MRLVQPHDQRQHAPGVNGRADVPARQAGGGRGPAPPRKRWPPAAPYPTIAAAAAAPQPSSSQQDTATARLPVLILPGFLANKTRAPTSQYQELRDSLLALQHPAVEVLQTNTADWLPTLSGGSFLFYLQRLADAVQQLHATHKSQVCLAGVSAGGWLARIALGSVPYKGHVFGLRGLVHTLVCLGTPHASLEAYPFGRAEEPWINELGLPDGVNTSLQFANHHYPSADSLRPTRIVCVVGSATKGRSLSLADVQQLVLGRTTLKAVSDAWFVQSAYEANCGDASVDGDGVTPLCSAVVPGADTLVIPACWHNKASGKLWYGSPEVVALWDTLLP